MAALTGKEILAELKKLGIYDSLELNSYLRSYKTYCLIQKKPYKEKRSSERIPVGENVRIFYRGKSYPGTVLNVSEKGMFIGIKKCFSPSSTIRVENELLKVAARVKRLTEMNGYYDGVGVELRNPTQDYTKYIRCLKSPL